MEVRTKRIFGIVLSVCILCLSILIVFQSAQRTAASTIEDFNPELQKAHFVSGNFYEGSTDYNETANDDVKNYKIKTNMYTVWNNKDDVDFFYKSYDFNYDKSAEFVLETELLSWDATIKTGGAGIMLRTGLGVSDPCVFFHARPEGLLILVRENRGEGYNYTFRTPLVSISYPLKLKVVVKNQKVTFWYKTSSSDYVKYSKTGHLKYSENGNKIYAGFAANSSTESYYATAEFKGYYATINTGNTESGSDVSSGDISTPEDPFPQDPEIEMNDVLLYDTFTDNNIFDGVSDFSDEAYITNPKWYHRGDSDLSECLQTNEDKTDRYIEMFDCQSDMLLTGNERWSDYSVSAKIKFTEDNEPLNTFFGISVRFSSIETNGYSAYSVIFKNGKSVGIYKMQYAPTFYGNIGNTLVSETKELEYLTAESTATEHIVKVEAFDNRITVYWDGEKLLEYVDEESLVNSFGRIGFIAKQTTVTIDDVKVVALKDLLNGDFDNYLGGNWDDPIPDYMKNYLKNPNNY